VGCAILPGGEHAWSEPYRTCTQGTHVYGMPSSHIGNRELVGIGTNVHMYYHLHLLDAGYHARDEVSAMVGQVHHDRCH